MGCSNIVTLTGLPCSGKTTIGFKLAEKLNYNFLDLDHYITEKYNISINNIFRISGEKIFREYESIALQEILNSKKTNNCLVLSLGGGTVCFGDNLNLCLNKTILIWLNTSFEIIYNRLLNSYITDRPIFSTHDLYGKLNHLYTERLSFYNKSHVIINICEVNINKTIDNIVENINNLHGK